MTAKVWEWLIINGKKTQMDCYPPLPKGDSRIIKQTDTADWGEDGIVLSTACWRQYIGTWEIKGGKFYLKKLEGCVKLAGDKPLLADWFSGNIRIPRGKLLQYVHMGFESAFEKELRIKIRKGVVLSQAVISNRERTTIMRHAT